MPSFTPESPAPARSSVRNIQSRGLARGTVDPALGEESRRHGRLRGFRSPFRLSRTNVSSASTIPAWTKEPNIGYKLIDARAETAHQKPSFRAAFKARRCLIPADGF